MFCFFGVFVVGLFVGFFSGVYCLSTVSLCPEDGSYNNMMQMFFTESCLVLTCFFKISGANVSSSPFQKPSLAEKEKNIYGCICCSGIELCGAAL